MSESSSSAVPSVEIPGTVVSEVAHTNPVGRVPAGAPHQQGIDGHVFPDGEPQSSAPAPSTGDANPVEAVTSAPSQELAETAASSSDAQVDASAAAEPATDIKPEEKAEEKAGEKKEPGRRGMASAGAAVSEIPAAPDAPVWPTFANIPDAAYVPDEEFDATDLLQVNRELNRARARIFRCSETLKMCQRTFADAQSAYDRAMRRALVSVSGGTAESRRALAEIQCEEFENRVVIGKQVVEEWRRRCNDARDDLKALENISHNVRASLDIR